MTAAVAAVPFRSTLRRAARGSRPRHDRRARTRDGRRPPRAQRRANGEKCHGLRHPPTGDRVARHAGRDRAGRAEGAAPSSRNALGDRAGKWPRAGQDALARGPDDGRRDRDRRRGRGPLRGMGRGSRGDGSSRHRGSRWAHRAAGRHDVPVIAAVARRRRRGRHRGSGAGVPDRPAGRGARWVDGAARRGAGVVRDRGGRGYGRREDSVHRRSRGSRSTAGSRPRSTLRGSSRPVGSGTRRCPLRIEPGRHPGAGHEPTVR